MAVNSESEWHGNLDPEVQNVEDLQNKFVLRLYGFIVQAPTRVMIDNFIYISN